MCFNLLHGTNNLINSNLIKIQKHHLKFPKQLSVNMIQNNNENNNTFIDKNKNLENNKLSKKINSKLSKKIYNINFKLNIEFNNTNNLNNNNLNNDQNDEINNNFPSFYDFLKKRELLEINSKKIYLENINLTNTIIKKAISKEIEKNEKLKKYKKYKKYNEKFILSKDLKLLTSISATEWARTWIYEMIHVPDYFPTFMYQDMFKMRDFGNKNNTKEYFYIGYYPQDVNLKLGPYYIAAFELVPKMRELRTYIIIQNPHYCIDSIYDEVKIKNFKKELQALSNDAYVFFKYDNLKSMSNERYYYSWLYN
jgi:hypothetical protein